MADFEDEAEQQALSDEEASESPAQALRVRTASEDSQKVGPVQPLAREVSL